MDAENDNLVKGLEDLKVADRLIPMGSQEFQKAILECDLSRENSDDDRFRKRSNTIDSTYGQRRHHSVSFGPNMVLTKPAKQGSHEEIHLKGILRHHYEDRTVEEEISPRRRNTLDNTYQVKRKFYTKPEKTNSTESIDRHEDTKQTIKKHSDSTKKCINDTQAYSKSGRFHHPNHIQGETRSPSSPRRSKALSDSVAHKRRISEEKPRSTSPNKVKLSQGVHT